MKYYTEEQIKEAFEIIYGHQDDVEYEYGQDGTVYEHSQGGVNYVNISHDIDTMQAKGEL